MGLIFSVFFFYLMKYVKKILVSSDFVFLFFKQETPKDTKRSKISSSAIAILR